MYDEVLVLEHSSIRITGDKNLYFDPFNIRKEVHDADMILITHEHFDHFSPKDIAMIRRDDTILVLPRVMEGQEEKADFAKENVVLLSPGEQTDVGDVHVEAVAAYNRYKPFHPKQKEWLGYVVCFNDTRYFVAGDTDPNEENKKVKCDVAIVPVGGRYTMNGKKAAELINAIRPKTAIPSHYGSIVGSAKDAEIFRKKVAEGIEVRR